MWTIIQTEISKLKRQKLVLGMFAGRRIAGGQRTGSILLSPGAYGANTGSVCNSL